MTLPVLSGRDAFFVGLNNPVAEESNYGNIFEKLGP